MLSDKSRQALSDEELMRQYLAGDDKAFETVYARRREGLRRFLERQCGSAAIGQELAQDAWCRPGLPADDCTLLIIESRA